MKPKASPEELLSLTRLLNSNNSDTRLDALEALLEIGKPYSLIAARALCQDPNETARNAATEALGDYGIRRQDLRRLTTALQDTNWVVRSTAADGLGRMGGATAYKRLLIALKDRHEIVRRDTARALVYFGANAQQPLEDAIGRETDELALHWLYYGLFCAGKKEALATFLQFLRSDDFLARSNVVRGVYPEDLTAQDAEMVIEAVKAYVATEDNPGTKTDAFNLLLELREHQQAESAD